MHPTRLFTFATHNLGDEMQSYAVLAHLGRVAAFADRDELADLPPDTPSFDCVMNSWFMLKFEETPRAPAPAVRPLWHGFATTRDDFLSGNWLPYLQAQREPIGCRDHFTLQTLQTHGIPAFWSGCLTLFMGAALPSPGPRGDTILFIDVPADAEDYIPAHITQRAERRSTFPPQAMLNDPLARWAATADLADRIARARLVVTRRLHAALPAASFGTPVVAIPDPAISYADRRFSGFETVLPVIYRENAAALRRLDWDNPPPAAVPAILQEAYAVFKSRLQQRGMAAAASLPSSPLDRLGQARQTILNIGRTARPGQLRLRLGLQTFPLAINAWSDRFIEVALQGFPGLSKFDFAVEAAAFNSDAWNGWGLLRDLAQPMAMRE